MIILILQLVSACVMGAGVLALITNSNAAEHTAEYNLDGWKRAAELHEAEKARRALWEEAARRNKAEADQWREIAAKQAAKLRKYGLEDM